MGVPEQSKWIAHDKPSSPESSNVSTESHAVAKLLNYRSQLAKLTDPSTDETRLTPSTRKWDSNTVQVPEEARRLAAVIDGTTRKTFSGASGIKTEWKSASSIFRGIDCTVNYHPIFRTDFHRQR